MQIFYLPQSSKMTQTPSIECLMWNSNIKLFVGLAANWLPLGNYWNYEKVDMK